MNDTYTDQIKESVDALLHNIEHRVSATDMERIREAFEFAAEAHKSQTRMSGQPYIVHPIAVARIVAEELELGPNSVIAAFLHDVVEDTDYTIEDIRERFGDDVAFLVGVVTKTKKEKYKHTKQIDNYRQILSSVEYDIRALLIKLSDRLHNMRTLDSMRSDKQMKIAGETDYFYAPLANKMGLYHVKSELETLSFRYRCPREFATIESMLEDEKVRNEKEIAAFTSKINELLAQNGISARTEVRYRLPYSIWRKMQSEGCDFAHVDGKHYVRIIYDNREDTEKHVCLRIYSILTDFFKERPGSVSNYINAPKENGYQSFQVKLLNEQGNWEEMHISSERMLRNSQLGCISERTESNVRLWLDKFREVLKDLAERGTNMDYMDYVTSSFYNDDILVFTPNGRGVILPKNATALDFAFEIHRDLGTHATHARINGKLSSVVTVLQRGDCVEIGNDSNSTPDANWKNSVCTYKAKNGMRSALAKQPTIRFHRGPQCHPLPGDEVIGFKEANGTITLHKRNCPDAIRLASQHGDSIVAVNFEEDKAVLYPVRIKVRGLDRYHLLSDIVECVTDHLQSSIDRLHFDTTDRIAECTIDFSVHSANELQTTINLISAIRGVDEVSRIDIE